MRSKKNGFLKYVVLVLIAAVVAVFVWNAGRHIERFENNQAIPKKIWTFWDSADTVPEFVKLCMESWKKYNPEYELHMLHKNTLSKFIDIPDNIQSHPNFNDTRSRFADLVRLYLLEKHGGIWIDASCLMYQPFDEWLPFDAGYFSYTYNQGHPEFKYPIIENWFIAAVPQHPFVVAWKREFLEIAKYQSVQAYLDSRKAMGVDVSAFEGMANYLGMHVAAQKIMQIDKYPVSSLTLKETSQAGGPFWFLIKNGWDANKAIEEACVDTSLRKPFLKFHGPSRDVFSSRLKTDMTNAKCHWS